jgi:CRP/FNR family cyclic AMP-dependent transcriptional regulator
MSTVFDPPAVPVTPPRSRARLLCEDPELASGIPREERRRAEQLVVAETTHLAAGAPVPETPRGSSGFVVLEGLLVREVTLAGRRSTEVLGAGDVICPVQRRVSVVPHDVRWHVAVPAVLACLDERFAMAARRWASLSAVIQGRLTVQGERQAVQLAIARLPRVEQRVLAVLWTLAERWGRVTPDGYVVPLRLTHESLGRMVGAQRPTVSLALTELTEQGSVLRRQDGSWLLSPTSLDELST